MDGCARTYVCSALACPSASSHVRAHKRTNAHTHTHELSCSQGRTRGWRRRGILMKRGGLRRHTHTQTHTHARAHTHLLVHSVVHAVEEAGHTDKERGLQKADVFENEPSVPCVCCACVCLCLCGCAGVCVQECA